MHQFVDYVLLLFSGKANRFYDYGIRGTVTHQDFSVSIKNSSAPGFNRHEFHHVFLGQSQVPFMVNNLNFGQAGQKVVLPPTCAV